MRSEATLSSPTTSRRHFASEGTWHGLADDPQDGHDIVEWIATQGWSDGKVGTSLPAVQRVLETHRSGSISHAQLTEIRREPQRR